MYPGLLLGELSNGQKGPKETAITVGLGWDSPRGPWVEERLSPHPPTSGGKVGEGIEAGFLLRRGMKLIAELIWKTRWVR